MVVVLGGAKTDAKSAAETLHDDGDGVQVGGLGVNKATTPTGRVERVKVTGAATPESKIALNVSTAPGPPGTIVRVAGVAARPNENGGQSTRRLNVAVRATPPPVA